MPKNSKTEKPPAVDKLIKPGIGVILAFVGYYFMKGLNVDIPRVDVTDELALREVFFGEGQGLNYVVLCHTPPADETKAGLPISSVFSDAMDSLSPSSSTSTSNLANFVLMDCTGTKLPSDKTVAERFNLNTKKRPTIFVSGKVGPPKQIPEKHLKTGGMLVKLLKSMLEPHAVKIESSKDLKAKCLNKDVCALLLKGGPPQAFVKEAVKNLLSMFPNVPIASLDSSTMLVTNLEEFLPEFKAGEHRFVVFKKVSGGTGEGEGRLITSMKTLEDGDSLSFNSMSKLIGDAQSWGAKLKKLSSLPQVKTRTKKLEEAERKKRERIQNKNAGGGSKKQQETPAGSFGSGASTDNDGSKEGRKAERDRRREEHQKNNPNYKEKTPEEKAEMERKRRQRMQEEAEKWNIGAEDAPSEGEPIDGGEGDGQDYFMDDEDSGDVVDGGDNEGDDEDEDVLDLD